MTVRVVPFETRFIQAAVELQKLAFPPPFDENLLWKAEHLHRHLELFPSGQFAAINEEGVVIGTCSNTRISEANWLAHHDWDTTVGGPFLDTFDVSGSTLYGLDISVHPNFRRMGVARALYSARFNLVQNDELLGRYGTACRLPGYARSGTDGSPEAYARSVVNGEITDPTLTPLLKMNLRYIETINNYMDDAESGHAAAMLEWLK